MANLRLLESGPHRPESNRRRVDQMLHQRLSAIFRERCRSDSSRIKEFLRAPDQTEQNLILDLILEQDPAFGQRFWKKMLRKLSLMWITVLGPYYDSAELLVRSGADVNELFGFAAHCYQLNHDKKSTVLHALLNMEPSEENERLSRLVTDHGADLEARDTLERTVLHVAVKNDRVQTFGMLLEKGADLRAQDSKGKTALLYAVKKDRVQMIQMILEKAVVDNVSIVNVADNKGKTPVLVAVSRSKAIELLSLLTKHGADLQARNFRGETALHLAMKEDLVNVAEILLEKGADLEAWDSEGQTALLCAVSYQARDQMFGMLLEKGADLRARDFRKKTVLLHALAENQVGKTKTFLEKAALENVDVVNEADDKGNTPLFIAAGSSEADKLVPLLMKHGADVSVKNADGENLLHRLSRGPVEHVDLARNLIEKGFFSVEDRDHRQYQPIHNAVAAGHHGLVKLYLDHGANVNSLGDDDESPLHIAAKSATKKLEMNSVIKTLLERGAEINRKTISKGLTPLHFACKLAFSCQSCALDERLRVLLSAGADILAEDHQGRKPFSFLVYRPRALTDKPSIWLILIKTLALKKVCQPSIELTEEKIFEQDSNWQNYYRDCLEQVNRMKSTKFIKTCTFFELLTKCHCQIAPLTRNPEFKSKFMLKLNVREFSAYAEDLLLALKRAEKHYQFMLGQEDVINEALYYMLPGEIVSEVVRYICDGCKNV